MPPSVRVKIVSAPRCAPAATTSTYAHYREPRAGRRSQGRLRLRPPPWRSASWVPMGSEQERLLDCVLVGDLSLDGGIRGIRGTLPIAIDARAKEADAPNRA